MRRTGDLTGVADRGAGPEGDRGSAAGVTRSSGPMITSDDPRTWESAGRRLRGLLRSRGADAWLAEDLAQETLARAVAKGIAFSDSDDLMRWCVPVAGNLLVDTSRRRRWADDGDVPDQPAGVDVEREVLARLELGVVLRHLATLPEPDRDAILSGLEPAALPCPRQEAVGQAVRRHRARQRLARLAAGAAAVWGVLWGARPRLGRPALVIALPAVALSGFTSLPHAPAAPPAATRAVLAQTTTSPDDAIATGRSASRPGARSSVADAVAPGAATPVLATTRQLVKHTAPTGDRIELGTTDRPAEGVLLCVEGLPLVQDRCVATSAPAGLSAEFVVTVDR